MCSRMERSKTAHTISASLAGLIGSAVLVVTTSVRLLCSANRICMLTHDRLFHQAQLNMLEGVHANYSEN